MLYSFFERFRESVSVVTYETFHGTVLAINVLLIVCEEFLVRCIKL